MELDSTVAKCGEFRKFAASFWNCNRPILSVYFFIFCACTPTAQKTKLVHVSTIASLSSAMFDQTQRDMHATMRATRSSRRACREATSGIWAMLRKTSTRHGRPNLIVEQASAEGQERTFEWQTIDVGCFLGRFPVYLSRAPAQTNSTVITVASPFIGYSIWADLRRDFDRSRFGLVRFGSEL